MKKSEINVLIVEDDRSSGLVMSESIKRLGFKPFHVTKAEDAIQMVKLKPVQLAIIDVLLPKTSGVDLAIELRKTRFGGSPIIFASGVFKDKSFATEAVKKANALDFLAKPFGFEEFSAAVNRALEPLFSIENWTVSSLLTRRLTSQREKVKSIERLGNIEGFDFPVIISVLLEAKSTGHLNIVTGDDQIFGATVQNGLVIAGDSEDLKPGTLDLLINRGFLAHEDVEIAKASGKGNVEYFVQQGFVSPHAVSEVKREQILHLLDTLVAQKSLQISYVPSDSVPDRAPSGLDMSTLVAYMLTKPDLYFDEATLGKFYMPVMTAPLRSAGAATSFVGDLDLMVKKNLSIEEAAKVSDSGFREILKAVHAAFLRREVGFDDLAKVKNLDTLTERFERLYTEFKIRQPHEIFEYFGADSEFRVADVIRIYNEYLEANHPNLLPKGASENLRRLCNDCFTTITEAYETLSSEQGRSEYDKGLKVQRGERLAYVHTLTEEGMDHLRRGQAQQALAFFKEAHKVLTSPRTMMLCIWADLKAQGSAPDREMLNKYLQQLDGLSVDEKKTPLFYMAMGLVKRGLGDGKAAQGFFEKAIQQDNSFVEAKREINSMNTQAQGAKKVDLLNANLSDVVSQIFRRKKG